jgi:hypothetical protein
MGSWLCDTEFCVEQIDYRDTADGADGNSLLDFRYNGVRENA